MHLTDLQPGLAGVVVQHADVHLLEHVLVGARHAELVLAPPAHPASVTREVLQPACHHVVRGQDVLEVTKLKMCQMYRCATECRLHYILAWTIHTNN